MAGQTVAIKMFEMPSLDKHRKAEAEDHQRRGQQQQAEGQGQPQGATDSRMAPAAPGQRNLFIEDLGADGSLVQGRREMLRGAMEVAVMMTVSHPHILQVYG